MGAGLVPIGNGNFAAQGPIGLIIAAYKRASLTAESIPNAGTYIPDLRKGTIHLLTLAGAAATIANPINQPAVPGFNNIFILVFTNASGGACTLTFGSAYDVIFDAPDDGDTSTLTLLNVGGTWFSLGGGGGGGGTPTEIRSPDLNTFVAAADNGIAITSPTAGSQVVISQQGNNLVVLRNNGIIDLGGGGSVVNIQTSSGGVISFFGHSFQGLQTVVGSRADPEAALANLLDALANYGLILNGTSA